MEGCRERHKEMMRREMGREGGKGNEREGDGVMRNVRWEIGDGRKGVRGTTRGGGWG